MKMMSRPQVPLPLNPEYLSDEFNDKCGRVLAGEKVKFRSMYRRKKVHKESFQYSYMKDENGGLIVSIDSDDDEAANEAASTCGYAKYKWADTLTPSQKIAYDLFPRICEFRECIALHKYGIFFFNQLEEMMNSFNRFLTVHAKECHRKPNLSAQLIVIVVQFVNYFKYYFTRVDPVERREKSLYGMKMAEILGKNIDLAFSTFKNLPPAVIENELPRFVNYWLHFYLVDDTRAKFAAAVASKSINDPRSWHSGRNACVKILQGLVKIVRKPPNTEILYILVLAAFKLLKNYHYDEKAKQFITREACSALPTDRSFALKLNSYSAMIQPIPPEQRSNITQFYMNLKIDIPNMVIAIFRYFDEFASSTKYSRSPNGIPLILPECADKSRPPPSPYFNMDEKSAVPMINRIAFGPHPHPIIRPKLRSRPPFPISRPPPRVMRRKPPRLPTNKDSVIELMDSDDDDVIITSSSPPSRSIPPPSTIKSRRHASSTARIPPSSTVRRKVPSSSTRSIAPSFSSSGPISSRRLTNFIKTSSSSKRKAAARSKARKVGDDVVNILDSDDENDIVQSSKDGPVIENDIVQSFEDGPANENDIVQFSEVGPATKSSLPAGDEQLNATKGEALIPIENIKSEISEEKEYIPDESSDDENILGDMLSAPPSPPLYEREYAFINNADFSLNKLSTRLARLNLRFHNSIIPDFCADTLTVTVPKEEPQGYYEDTFWLPFARTSQNIDDSSTRRSKNFLSFALPKVKVKCESGIPNNSNSLNTDGVDVSNNFAFVNGDISSNSSNIAINKTSRKRNSDGILRRARLIIPNAEPLEGSFRFRSYNMPPVKSGIKVESIDPGYKSSPTDKSISRRNKKLKMSSHALKKLANIANRCEKVADRVLQPGSFSSKTYKKSISNGDEYCNLSSNVSNTKIGNRIIKSKSNSTTNKKSISKRSAEPGSGGDVKKHIANYFRKISGIKSEPSNYTTKKESISESDENSNLGSNIKKNVANINQCEKIAGIKSEPSNEPISMNDKHSNLGRDVTKNIANHCENVKSEPLNSASDEGSISLESDENLNIGSDVDENVANINHCKNVAGIKSEPSKEPISMKDENLNFGSDVAKNIANPCEKVSGIKSEPLNSYSDEESISDIDENPNMGSDNEKNIENKANHCKKVNGIKSEPSNSITGEEPISMSDESFNLDSDIEKSNAKSDDLCEDEEVSGIKSEPLNSNASEEPISVSEESLNWDSNIKKNIADHGEEGGGIKSEPSDSTTGEEPISMSDKSSNLDSDIVKNIADHSKELGSIKSEPSISTTGEEPISMSDESLNLDSDIVKNIANIADHSEEVGSIKSEPLNSTTGEESISMSDKSSNLDSDNEKNIANIADHSEEVGSIKSEPLNSTTGEEPISMSDESLNLDSDIVKNIANIADHSEEVGSIKSEPLNSTTGEEPISMSDESLNLESDIVKNIANIADHSKEVGGIKSEPLNSTTGEEPISMSDESLNLDSDIVKNIANIADNSKEVGGIKSEPLNSTTGEEPISMSDESLNLDSDIVKNIANIADNSKEVGGIKSEPSNSTTGEEPISMSDESLNLDSDIVKNIANIADNSKEVGGIKSEPSNSTTGEEPISMSDESSNLDSDDEKNIANIADNCEEVSSIKSEPSKLTTGEEQISMSDESSILDSDIEMNIGDHSEEVGSNKSEPSNSTTGEEPISMSDESSKLDRDDEKNIANIADHSEEVGGIKLEPSKSTTGEEPISMSDESSNLNSDNEKIIANITDHSEEVGSIESEPLNSTTGEEPISMSDEIFNLDIDIEKIIVNIVDHFEEVGSIKSDLSNPTTGEESISISDENLNLGSDIAKNTENIANHCEKDDGNKSENSNSSTKEESILKSDENSNMGCDLAKNIANIVNISGKKSISSSGGDAAKKIANIANYCEKVGAGINSKISNSTEKSISKIDENLKFGREPTKNIASITHHCETIGEKLISERDENLNFGNYEKVFERISQSESFLPIIISAANEFHSIGVMRPMEQEQIYVTKPIENCEYNEFACVQNDEFVVLPSERYKSKSNLNNFNCDNNSEIESSDNLLNKQKFKMGEMVVRQSSDGKIHHKGNSAPQNKRSAMGGTQSTGPINNGLLLKYKPKKHLDNLEREKCCLGVNPDQLSDKSSFIMSEVERHSIGKFDFSLFHLQNNATLSPDIRETVETSPEKINESTMSVKFRKFDPENLNGNKKRRRRKILKSVSSRNIVKSRMIEKCNEKKITSYISNNKFKTGNDKRVETEKISSLGKRKHNNISENYKESKICERSFSQNKNIIINSNLPRRNSVIFVSRNNSATTEKPKNIQNCCEIYDFVDSDENEIEPNKNFRNNKIANDVDSDASLELGLEDLQKIGKRTGRRKKYNNLPRNDAITQCGSGLVTSIKASEYARKNNRFKEMNASDDSTSSVELGFEDLLEYEKSKRKSRRLVTPIKFSRNSRKNNKIKDVSYNISDIITPPESDCEQLDTSDIGLLRGINKKTVKNSDETNQSTRVTRSSAKINNNRDLVVKLTRCEVNDKSKFNTREKSPIRNHEDDKDPKSDSSDLDSSPETNIFKARSMRSKNIKNAIQNRVISCNDAKWKESRDKMKTTDERCTSEPFWSESNNSSTIKRRSISEDNVYFDSERSCLVARRNGKSRKSEILVALNEDSPKFVLFREASEKNNDEDESSSSSGEYEYIGSMPPLVDSEDILSVNKLRTIPLKEKSLRTLRFCKEAREVFKNSNSFFKKESDNKANEEIIPNPNSIMGLHLAQRKLSSTKPVAIDQPIFVNVNGTFNAGLFSLLTRGSNSVAKANVVDNGMENENIVDSVLTTMTSSNLNMSNISNFHQKPIMASDFACYPTCNQLNNSTRPHQNEYETPIWCAEVNESTPLPISLLATCSQNEASTSGNSLNDERTPLPNSLLATCSPSEASTSGNSLNDESTPLPNSLLATCSPSEASTSGNSLNDESTPLPNSLLATCSPNAASTRRNSLNEESTTLPKSLLATCSPSEASNRRNSLNDESTPLPNSLLATCSPNEGSTHRDSLNDESTPLPNSLLATCSPNEASNRRNSSNDESTPLPNSLLATCSPNEASIRRDSLNDESTPLPNSLLATCSPNGSSTRRNSLNEESTSLPNSLLATCSQNEASTHRNSLNKESDLPGISSVREYYEKSGNCLVIEEQDSVQQEPVDLTPKSQLTVSSNLGRMFTNIKPITNIKPLLKVHPSTNVRPDRVGFFPFHPATCSFDSGGLKVQNTYLKRISTQNINDIPDLPMINFSYCSPRCKCDYCLLNYVTLLRNELRLTVYMMQMRAYYRSNLTAISYTEAVQDELKSWQSNYPYNSKFLTFMENLIVGLLTNAQCDRTGDAYIKPIQTFCLDNPRGVHSAVEQEYMQEWHKKNAYRSYPKSFADLMTSPNSYRSPPELPAEELLNPSCSISPRSDYTIPPPNASNNTPPLIFDGACRNFNIRTGSDSGDEISSVSTPTGIIKPNLIPCSLEHTGYHSALYNARKKRIADSLQISAPKLRKKELCNKYAVEAEADTEADAEPSETTVIYQPPPSEVKVLYPSAPRATESVPPEDRELWSPSRGAVRYANYVEEEAVITIKTEILDSPEIPEIPAVSTIPAIPALPANLEIPAYPLIPAKTESLEICESLEVPEAQKGIRTVVRGYRGTSRKRRRGRRR